MFVSVPFLLVYHVSDGVLHETDQCFSCHQEIFLLHHFGLLQCVFCAPRGGLHPFSEGVLILAGVVIGDAIYTSIVILIWISNTDYTIAEVISFDVDLINIGNVRVVDYLDTY